MHRRLCCLLWLVLAGLVPVACNPATSGQSPHLDVVATSDRDTIEEGETVTLKASVNGRTDHYAFHWENQTGGEARFADPDSAETEVGPLNVLGAYKFRVVASSADGRFGQDFLVITVVSEGELNDNAEDEDNANEDEDNDLSGRDTIELEVKNTGDRPVQVGSHYHFFETNKALDFDRKSAYGMRLMIPAGTAVRFEPGQSQKVALIALAGDRYCHGLNGLVNGNLDDDKVKQQALAKAKEQNFKGI